MTPDKLTAALAALRVKGFRAKRIDVTFETDGGEVATIPFEVEMEITDIVKSAEDAITAKKDREDQMQKQMALLFGQQAQQAMSGPYWSGSSGGAQTGNPFAPFGGLTGSSQPYQGAANSSFGLYGSGSPHPWQNTVN